MRTHEATFCAASGSTHPTPADAAASSGGAPRGLLIVYTGDGKGKTSAALGMLVRARGWAMRVAMYQFIKSADLQVGEHQGARSLDVEIVPLGRGLTWQGGSMASHRDCAVQGWQRCRQALSDPGYDAVILDEITYPVAYGWLSAEEVLAAIRARPPHQHVVLTGRGAPEELIEAADLVTEMRERKHPQRAGVPAQRGVEF